MWLKGSTHTIHLRRMAIYTKHSQLESMSFSSIMTWWRLLEPGVRWCIKTHITISWKLQSIIGRTGLLSIILLFVTLRWSRLHCCHFIFRRNLKMRLMKELSFLDRRLQGLVWHNMLSQLIKEVKVTKLKQIGTSMRTMMKLSLHLCT